MPFAASLSTLPETEAALEQACGELMSRLGSNVPDLLFLFVSHDHAKHHESLAAEIRRRTGAKHLIGCTAETVIGAHQEIEQSSSLALWGAVLPGREVIPFHIEFE